MGRALLSHRVPANPAQDRDLIRHTAVPGNGIAPRTARCDTWPPWSVPTARWRCGGSC
jgi:hypothetical protein